MLKIGVVGLGGIFQKAYAPVISGLQDQAEFILISQNQEKRQRIAKQYNFSETGIAWQEAAQIGLDAVMIHSATQVHYQQVKYFLGNNINVYVDKPLATELTEVAELIHLAKERQLLLTVGFNRRFAPLVQQLRNFSDKQEISAIKNRPRELSTLDFQAYDLLIHSLDTALYLLNQPVDDISYDVKYQNDTLQTAKIILKTSQTTAVAGISLQTGNDLEEIRLTTSDAIAAVNDLNSLSLRQNSHDQTILPDKWEPMLTTRGFAPLIQAFINAVVTSGENPVSLESVYQSHRIISELLQAQK